MHDELEILLFDIRSIYKTVHESARAICSERGIPLRVIDLAIQENEKVATQYGVKAFPQCVLVRGDKVIGRNSVVIQTPKAFSDWIENSLKEETD